MNVPAELSKTEITWLMRNIPNTTVAVTPRQPQAAHIPIQPPRHIPADHITLHQFLSDAFETIPDANSVLLEETLKPHGVTNVQQLRDVYDIALDFDKKHERLKYLCSDYFDGTRVFTQVQGNLIFAHFEKLLG